MEVPQYYRQQRLAASSGVVPFDRGTIYSATRPYREIAEMGNVLTQIGLDFMVLDEQAKYHDQYNRAKIEALKRYNEYRQSILTNADTESYIPGLNEITERIKEELKFTNSKARDDFNIWIENESLNQTRAVQTHKFQVDVRNYTQNFNLSVETAKDIGAQSPDNPSYEQAKINLMSLYGIRPNEETKKPEIIEDWYNPLLYSDQVRMKLYEDALADMEIKRQKFISEQAEQWLDQEATRIATESGNWDAAVDFLAKPDTTKFLQETYGLSSDVIDGLIENAQKKAKIEKDRAKKIKDELQEKTEKQAWLDLWAGKLQTDDITSKLEEGSLDIQQAKNLRKSLISPEESDLKALEKVLEAKYDMGSGIKTKREALDTLYKNANKIESTKAQSLQNSIYEIQNKSDSYWTKEAMSYMEELIRSKDPMSGLFTDDAYEISKSIEAKLSLDEFIESAKREGKPITGRDIIIKAHEIALPIKQDVEQHREELPPEKIGIGKREKKQITKEIARHYLELADGDRKEAQRLARLDGYVW